MIKVLLVDDHDLVRQGVRRILELSGEVEVVGEAASGEDAVRKAQEQVPDIVLMDVQMPGLGGIPATRRITQLLPSTRVIALTVFDQDPFPAQLHEAGAKGYVTKGCPADEMLEAIRIVHSGERYVCSTVARRHELVDLEGTSSTPFERLSRRELKVLKMILNGEKTQDISDHLSVSLKTVSTHKQRILFKLGVATEIELARLAYRWGVIADESDERAHSGQKNRSKDGDLLERPSVNPAGKGSTNSRPVLPCNHETRLADCGESQSLFPIVVGGLLHDARNTLVGVGYRVNEILDPSTTTEFSELVRTHSKALVTGLTHLERVVELLHDISRTYYEPSYRGEHKLPGLLLDIIENFRNLHPEIRYSENVAEKLSSAAIPPGVVAFVAQEFLENATKYARPRVSTHVDLTVAASRDGKSILIECRDNGRGIPQSVLENIETESIRPPSHSSHGGFGLYLISQIAKRLEGRISARRLDPHGSVIAACFSSEIELKNQFG